MLDRKQFLIIQKLVETQIISKQVLQKSLNLTPRQIDYNLEKINDSLKSRKIELINYDGAFVSVPDEAHDYLITISSDFLDPDKYLFDKDERLDLLFLILINGGAVGINDLISVLDVSSSTMHKDLRELKQLLNQGNLNLDYEVRKGYRIIGTEEAIRWHLANIIVKRVATDNYRIFNWFFSVVQGQNINHYIKIISKKARQLNILFVEDHKLQFIYTYVAELTRIRENPDFLPSVKVDIERLKQTAEYQLAKELLDEEAINNLNSISYITILLLCTTIGGEKKLDFDDEVYSLNQTFVNEFASLSGIYFRDVKEISNQIFTHFRSMYYRKLFDFPVNNPLTEQVKEAYSDVFVLVKKALLVIKDQVGILPDSEVAFLTLHLMNFIYSKNQTNAGRPVAAIVCRNGIATSTLLYLQLTNIFPEINFLPPFQFDELDEKLDSINIIFSTFYRAKLFKKNKPCFIVNPVLTANEKSLLVQKVHMALDHKSTLSLSSVISVVEKYVPDQMVLDNIRDELSASLFHPHQSDGKFKRIGLLDVVDENMLQLNVDVDDPKIAIEISAKPLLENKIISRKYIKKIIARYSENEYDNFIIAPQVALPHSQPNDGARSIGMSITSLNKPCRFGTKFGGSVKYIFVLSAINKSAHLGILKDLMQLITDSNFLELVDKGNKEDVMRYMKKVLR